MALKIAAERLSAQFAQSLDQHVRPLLKTTQLPGLPSGEATYLKFEALAYAPLLALLFVAVVARGHLTINRFLGLYIFLFLAASASVGFTFLMLSNGLYSLDQEPSVYSLEGVTLEHFLLPLCHTALVSLFFFLLHPPYPGAPRSHAAAVFGRLWGAGVFLLQAGYAFFYLTHASFAYLRFVVAVIFPLLALQYLSFAPYIVANPRSSFGTLLATLLPSLYSLLVYAAAHHFGFYRITASGTLGYKFLGLPIEEAGLVCLVSTLVVQGQLIWDSIAEPAQRYEPRIKLTQPKRPAANQSAAAPAVPVASPQKAQPEAVKSPAKAAVGKAPVSDATSSPKKSPAAASPAAGSPQGGKKKVKAEQ